MPDSERLSRSDRSGTPMSPEALARLAVLVQRGEACPHLDDSTHDGRWCGYCNPDFGGDRNGGVRRMADRWWIKVCPQCNGLVGERTQAHNETCPNRQGRMFVPRDVEVAPTMRSIPRDTVALPKADDLD